MAMRIEKTFQVKEPMEQVWSLLSDPKEVATCVPGAKITEQVDEKTYKGAISVKVGPSVTDYKGELQILRLDPENHEIEILGKGQDVRGRGSASMKMTGKLRSLEDGGTEVTSVSEVNVVGILAQMGSRVITRSRTSCLEQFTKNFQARLAQPADAPAAEGKPAYQCRFSGLGRRQKERFTAIPEVCCLASIRLESHHHASLPAQPGDEPVKDPDALMRRFERLGYIADRALATAVYLIAKLRKPLLIEGHAGLGKTEVAKVLGLDVGDPLIRLQCYEGLDVSSAVYEWNYQKQLLAIKIQEGTEQTVEEKEKHIFSREFLLERPLLQSILAQDASPVLLIDEIDRADEAFEAFLLELLSDFQITVPEMGTIKAKHIPYVILTSNRIRELSDALKRRCLYHWIDYPSLKKNSRLCAPGCQVLTQILGCKSCASFRMRGNWILRNLPAYPKHWIAFTP
jgi:carbon monoxide dehydrogenase subunit G